MEPVAGMKAGRLASLVGLAGNGFLCAIKMAAGLATSSLSLLSDGVNSLTDVVSSVAIYVAVRVSAQEADEGHPFGHHRAEPIAGLVVAIFAGIAGFEILKQAVVRLYTREAPVPAGAWPFLVLLVSILVKVLMSWFFERVGRRMNSPALLAASVESRMDVLVSLTALLGVGGVYWGLPWLDSLMGLVISLFIFRAGYKIGLENIDYLMGRSPDPELIRAIQERIASIEGIRGVDRLKAHYVGTYVHVEVEIAADRDMSTEASHELAEKVRSAVETLPAIDKAFVHVNPR